jgi:hypothetical protein
MDNVFFRPIPTPTATNWTTWIPFGSTWRYFTNTLPTNWFVGSFNDSAWPIGTAKFGAGSGPTNIVTRVPQHCPIYYFRKNFVISSSDVEELLLSATCTDDSGSAPYPIRVFLNGNEIKSRIETVTAQGNETRYFDLLPFASFLQAGTNTIAVLVSNYWSSWDDVAFDVSLKAILYHPVIPHLDLVRTNFANPRLSAETPVGTIWQIQSRDGLSGNWQPVQSFTNTTGIAQSIQDNGQNGRLSPAAAPTRFYRLVPW